MTEKRQNPDWPNDEALEAPPELISALKRVANPQLFIPRTVDEAILRAADRHLTGRKEEKFRWFYLLKWLSAAAALLLLLALIPQLLRHPTAAPDQVPGFAREDINHDGKVDILDALALARRVRDHTTDNLQLDVTGDGVVDERDVAAVAASAVSLQKRGRS